MNISGYSTMKKDELNFMINYPTIQFSKAGITKLKKLIEKNPENIILVAHNNDGVYITNDISKNFAIHADSCNPQKDKDTYKDVKNRLFGKVNETQELNYEEFKTVLNTCDKCLYITLFEDKISITNEVPKCV